jgi:hypothetical protein
MPYANNHFLASKGFSCVSIVNWVVVFKIKNDIFYVDKIMLGTILI